MTYEDMKLAFDNSPLPDMGIKLPADNTQSSATLLVFFNNKNTIITKAIVEQLVCGRLGIATKDIQAVRHLGKQAGFDIKQGGDVHNGVLLKRGEYCFVGFESHNKYWSFSRRTDTSDFEHIKKKYKYVCATCGSKEGTHHRYTNEIVVLEKGHMNPHLEMTDDNIIPQCHYCNARYKNNFVFDSFGAVKDVTDEYITSLPRERQIEILKLLEKTI